MKPEYIFVVGSFRSGTTLVYNILNSSRDIRICWETHFLGHFLTPGFSKIIRRVGDLEDDANASHAVDFLYSINRGFWRWLRENVDKEFFTQQVLASNRDDRSIFKLLMHVYANDKLVKGEKTPSHLYYVPTLFDWFPNSKVIHTFRDPRAIFVSELRKKKKPQFSGARHQRLQRVGLLVPYILIHVTLTWLRAVHLHRRYLKSYPHRYYLVKFEDLLNTTEQQLKLMSDFLGIELHPQLLENIPSNSSYKEKRTLSGIDVGAASRWRSEISSWVNRWFSFFCGSQLKEFGYL